MGIPRTGPRGALNIITATLALCAGLSGTAAPASAARTGTLAVVVRSGAAARPPLRVTIDSEICGATVPDESILVTNGLLANAVVSLPGLKGTHAASVEIANDKCRFVPRVAIAAPGAALKMISRDATLHTVHAQHQGKALFNVGLPVPNITLSRPAQGRGPVALKCNTHPWMSGHVFLADDRASLSGANGVGAFEQLPEGTHRIAVWHEALGSASGTATISAGRTTTVEITLAGK